MVLIDLAMPGMPGLEAIPHLRRMLPELGIVALTVMNTKSFRQAALSAGADVFVPKASMRTDLLPAIRQIMQTGRTKVVEPVAPPTVTEPPGEQAGPRRILIMEDDAYLCRLYSKALRAVGYEVHSARNVQEARDLLAQVRFDVLLCDVYMGSERGTDLLREYSNVLSTNGTQVVMVSGQSQYRDMCERMGAEFFLEKPVAIGTLVALVDRLTARKEFHPAEE